MSSSQLLTVYPSYSFHSHKLHDIYEEDEEEEEEFSTSQTMMYTHFASNRRYSSASFLSVDHLETIMEEDEEE
jgi:hypothetical protein